jgi:hypothetical protein
VLNPNKLMAAIIAIVVLSLCAGAMLGGAWWGHQEVKAAPKFKIGDCFRAKPPMWRWSAADGMVFNLDSTAYLVVYAVYLKSRSPIDPAFAGVEQGIAGFDKVFQIVPCPRGW